MNALTSLAALATVLNDGVAATFTPTDTVSLLTAMEDNASTMAKAIGTAESAIGDSAKAWGCNFINLNKSHGIDSEALAKRCRTALGWPDLKGEAGSKVKTRFNTWRSNIGIVLGEWDDLEQAVRDELLGGTRSFITVYKAIKDAETKAKREKDAAAAAEAKALADAVAAASNVTPLPTPNVVADNANLSDHIMALADMVGEATDADLNAAYDAMQLLIEAYDARINAAKDVAANG